MDILSHTSHILLALSTLMLMWTSYQFVKAYKRLVVENDRLNRSVNELSEFVGLLVEQDITPERMEHLRTRWNARAPFGQGPI